MGDVLKDIHKGFQDVGDSEQAKLFFQLLDNANRLESIQEYRRHIRELYPVEDGHRILDIGCGLGHEVQELASLVGSDGRVVGVDNNAPLIAEARRRTEGSHTPLEFFVGDAGKLEFSDNAFDLCRAERFLIFLEDPEKALAEMVRVVRPGGTVVISDFDYARMRVEVSDPALMDRVRKIRVQSVPSALIGRELPSLFHEMGLQEVKVVPHVIMPTYAMYRLVDGGVLENAVNEGSLSRSDYETWWREVEKSARTGHFVAACPGYIVGGYKPVLDGET